MGRLLGAKRDGAVVKSEQVIRQARNGVDGRGRNDVRRNDGTPTSAKELATLLLRTSTINANHDFRVIPNALARALGARRNWKKEHGIAVAIP